MTPQTPLSRPEFIALMAMLTATVAFSIDAMLPALPEIGEALTAETPNRAQLIITSFVLGLGLGTFIVGPLSDAFGRKPVILAGAGLYCAGSALAYVAPTLELLLAARALQGLGAAAPRIVTLAIVRDASRGREMARMMSFVMLIFSLVPAIAPSIGAGIMWLTGWRGIFMVFIVFSILSMAWLILRQPETLPVEARRPLRVRALAAAVAEVLSYRLVRLCIAIHTLCFAMLFAVLSTTQPVFDRTFGQGTAFPLWFALIALLAASASILNARLVMRLGMVRLVTAMLIAQMILSSAMIVLWLSPLPQTVIFAAYVIWTTSVFFQAGMTLGNLNAIAMEPLGHVAGMAASVIGALSTVGSVLVAVPIGQAFDGTPLPIAIGILACAIAAFVLMLRLRQIAPATA